MSDLLTALENPYWDAVKDYTQPSYKAHWHPDNADLLEVDPYPRRYGPTRTDYVSEYAWTISDPASVEFVTNHAGRVVVDPLAGTGYWAWLLRQAGVSVSATDLNPPNEGENGFHKAGKVWSEVGRADARDLPWSILDRTTLLLSWPGYGAAIGEQIARAFKGSRIIYIGESEGCSCGTDGMFEFFESDFDLVAEHFPVQWSGLHDEIRVYDRKEMP